MSAWWQWKTGQENLEKNYLQEQGQELTTNSKEIIRLLALQSPRTKCFWILNLCQSNYKSGVLPRVKKEVFYWKFDFNKVTLCLVSSTVSSINPILEF